MQKFTNQYQSSLEMQTGNTSSLLIKWLRLLVLFLSRIPGHLSGIFFNDDRKPGSSKSKEQFALKMTENINSTKMKSKNKIIKWAFIQLLLVCSTTNSFAQPYPTPGDHTVCLNATEPYGVVLNSGSTYQWSVTPVSGGNGTITAGATPNLISINWTNSGTATLQVIETNSQGCASDPVTILVTINQLPTASVTSNNSPICSGSDAIFTLTGTAGAVVTYNINGGGSQTVTISGGGTATVTVTGATANQTLNLVSVTNPSGGCSQSLSGSSTVVVNPALTATITANNSPICAGANATFTITGTSGAVVTYNINGGANQTVTLTGGSATVTVTGATVNQTLNLVSMTSGTGCTQTLSGSSTVVVNALPTASVTSNNSPICPGADAVFTLGGTSGAVVTYNINGGANQTITLTGGTATVTVPGVTTNQTLNLVSVSGAGGCSQSLSGSSTVIVNPTLTASITANNSPICTGANATFTLTGSSGAVVTYNINGGANQTVTLTGGTATVTVTGATANQTLNLVSINSPSGGCSQSLSGSSTVTVTPKPNTSPITHN